MAAKRLDTKVISEVEYFPSQQLLKALLKSGYIETYQPITQARYEELISGEHHHDIDIYYMNFIKPSTTSSVPSPEYKAQQFKRRITITVAVIAVIVFLGLLNSGSLAVLL